MNKRTILATTVVLAILGIGSEKTASGESYVHVGYDGLGRKAWESKQTTKTREELTDDDKKIYDYDAAGRLISVHLPRPDSGSSEGPVYRYIYDRYSNLIGIFDPLNRLTVFKYDCLHNQTVRHIPFIPASPETIDMVEEVYAAKPSNLPAETKEYDQLCRMTRKTDLNKQDTKFLYNNRGLLEYEKHYEFIDTTPADSQNDNWVNDTPSLVIGYTYDNLGRRKDVTVNGIVEQHFTYDAEGRVTSVTTPQGVIAYEYNRITGQMKFMRTPADGSDTEIEYSYDCMNRLSHVIVHRRNGLSINEQFDYTYNAVGSLESVNRPNGICSTYNYDALNRLNELVNKDSSGNVLSRFVYQLAVDGKRESVTEIFGEQNITIAWGYDNLNRMTSEDYDAPGTDDDYNQTYNYDLAGNRLNDVLNGIPRYFHYNVRDLLLKETSDQSGTNILVQYQYNDNGSMTQKAVTGGDTFIYSYNLLNQLHSFTVGGVTTTYKYDPDGKRVQKAVAGGQTTNYLIDRYNHTGYPQVLKETTGSTNISYVVGHQVLSQVMGTNNPKYMLHDGHGSVRQVANAAGTITSTYHYDAYGQLLPNSDTTETRILYTNQMLDNELGFYDNWHRWYDPSTGRFNQSDTFGGNNYDPKSLHKYLYAHANPINNIDPSGYFSISEISVVQFIQKIWRSKWVQYSWKGYSAATTTMDAIQLISQITLTGTVNPLLAASMATDLVPFGKIVKSVRGLRNLGKGVRVVDEAAEGLTGAYRNMGRGKNAAEALGELGAESVALGHELEKVADFERSIDGHGFDFIFKNPQTGSYVVVEAKGGASHLSTLAGGYQQMSHTWIKESIERVRITNPNLADRLLAQADNHILEAMVVSVPINNVTDSVEAVKYAYVGWDEIGERVFGTSGF